MGCWTPVERFTADGRARDGLARRGRPASAHASFACCMASGCLGEVDWDMLGRHNAANALAALVAARHAGVDEQAALEALRRFGGVKRRLEVRGMVRDIVVYDDFAHHPTAIATTLDGVRRKAGQRARHRGARAALEHDEARHAQGGAGRRRCAARTRCSSTSRPK